MKLSHEMDICTSFHAMDSNALARSPHTQQHLCAEEREGDKKFPLLKSPAHRGKGREWNVSKQKWNLC